LRSQHATEVLVDSTNAAICVRGTYFDGGGAVLKIVL
jgi:hypothetical protein